MEIQKKQLKDFAQTENFLALQSMQLGNWYKQYTDKAPDQPTQRKFHSSVVHKSSVFIYGGIPSSEAEDHFNQQKTIYRYNISNKNWHKSNTNFLNNNSFNYISGHSTAMFNNMMYLFGGINYKTNQYTPGLWCLNIQSYNWKRQQLKCYNPSPRQFGTMIIHQRNTLLLYGGKYKEEHLNDIHLYRIDNKSWIQIEQSSYDMKIPCRLKPALVSHGQYIYLFGGQRQTLSNQSNLQTILLDDFYQIHLLYKPMNSKPDVWAKEVITQYKPAPRVANFININERFLLLWGGQNMYNNHKTNQNGFWIFHLHDLHWSWIKLKQTISPFPQYGFSINYTQEKLFIFGEYQINKEQDSKLNGNFVKQNASGFLIYHIDIKEADHKFSQPKNRPKFSQMGILGCNSCKQYSFSLKKSKKLNEFSLFKDNITQRMQFVYSAFGLLLDNAFMLHAKECRILFHHNFKEKYCSIFDNGNSQFIWSNNSDFIADLLIFRTYVQQNIDQLQQISLEDLQKSFMKQDATHNNHHQIIQNPHINASISINSAIKQTKQQKQMKQKQMKDKEQERLLKERKRQAKKNYRKKIDDRKQFSKNIKLGAMRIGDRMIYINKYGVNLENRRVFVIEKSESLNNKEVNYKSYYYIFQNNSLIDHNMEIAKKYIDQEYKTYFKLANDHKEQGCNFVFITNLKEIVNELGQFQQELKENSKTNDVYFCQKRQLQTLQQFTILQSIDVSLKTYLSLLYLKNDDTKIFLGVGQHKAVQVSSLELFQKIDNLAKTDKIIDLVQALDLQNCNIIEVYYNKTNNNRSRQLNRKTTNSFNCFNGVLLYYKNRLISRYKYQLGQVNRIFKNKPKSIQQSLMMFGFIQIKDQFQVNMFKTAFVRDDLLYEVYHRLKFIEKYVQRLSTKSEGGKNKPLDQRYQKNDRGDKPDQKKRPKQSSNQQMENSKHIVNID